MDIDALRSFIAFVDTGSFTRAAKQICRTQSAISMQMKKLEQEANQRLFIKKGRNLSLTTEGQVLVSYARRILALHDDVLTEFATVKNNRPLIIGCPDDYVVSVLPTIIQLIQDKTPNQKFRIHCDNTVKLRIMLDNGEIDLAIITRAPESQEGYLLQPDKAVWVYYGHKELLTRPTLPLILFEEDCKVHSAAVDGLDKINRKYSIVCISPSATAIKAIIKNGTGIGAMVASTVPDDFTIINDPSLPPLAAIDIVLAVTSTPHPHYTATEVAQLSALYRRGIHASNKIKIDKLEKATLNCIF